MDKYELDYTELDIVNKPELYVQMVEKSGQRLSPCVEIEGVLLADVSGAEVEEYLLREGLVEPNNKELKVPIDSACGK